MCMTVYCSVSSGTIKLMASLMFSPAEQLVVRMMDVGRQSNGSDCGVLAIASAYICSGNDPCKIKNDHRSIRQHLADCLEKCLSHSLRLLSVGLLISGTPSRWTFTVPLLARAIKWPSVTCVRLGTTSTARTSLTSLTMKWIFPESVSCVLQNNSFLSGCGHMY